MDPVTLPMTIPELRVEGAPVLVLRVDGVWCSGIYLAPDTDPNWCIVWVEGNVHVVALDACALDLHHPNGERIARAFHGRAPTPTVEDLAYLRDGVLATVAMVSE